MVVAVGVVLTATRGVCVGAGVCVGVRFATGVGSVGRLGHGWRGEPDHTVGRGVGTGADQRISEDRQANRERDRCADERAVSGRGQGQRRVRMSGHGG